MTINEKEIMREIRIRLADKVKEGFIIDATIVEETLKEVEDIYEKI